MYLGLLRPGDRVLAARAQARRLGVDPRLVMAAYAELEREGLVVRRERSGVYLARTAHVPGGPAEQLVDWAAEVLLQGLARGLRVREVPALLERAVGSVPIRAVCVECNDDQLYSLCEELGNDYGFETVPLELERLVRPGPRERSALSQADLVVTTSSHADEVRRVAGAHGKAVAAVDLNPEWSQQMLDLLEAGAVYLVATDARFASKMRAMFRRAHGGSNMSFVILGRDDPASIPAGTPVFVTRKACERFDAGAALPVLPGMRVFAPDSARRLLRHLVQANIGQEEE